MTRSVRRSLDAANVARKLLGLPLYDMAEFLRVSTVRHATPPAPPLCRVCDEHQANAPDGQCAECWTFDHGDDFSSIERDAGWWASTR